MVHKIQWSSNSQRWDQRQVSFYVGGTGLFSTRSDSRWLATRLWRCWVTLPAELLLIGPFSVWSPAGWGWRSLKVSPKGFWDILRHLRGHQTVFISSAPFLVFVSLWALPSLSPLPTAPSHSLPRCHMVDVSSLPPVVLGSEFHVSRLLPVPFFPVVPANAANVSECQWTSKEAVTFPFYHPSNVTRVHNTRTNIGIKSVPPPVPSSPLVLFSPLLTPSTQSHATHSFIFAASQQRNVPGGEDPSRRRRAAAGRTAMCASVSVSPETTLPNTGAF